MKLFKVVVIRPATPLATPTLWTFSRASFWPDARGLELAEYRGLAFARFLSNLGAL